MTDISFELVEEPGTDVTFELLPGGVTGPVDAGDVSVDVAGTPTPLDDVLTGIGAKLTRRVAVFATDFDPTGSFTTVPLLPGGDTPRAYLTGATVLVVGGDHLGLWTIPASGAATAGAALAPGDVIASQTGRMAVAWSADGSTVSGVLLQADVPYVDAALAAEAGAREQADDALGERIDNVETTAGADGASAYEVAVANGFVGDEAAWLASLVGPQGDPGPAGADGADGQDGTDGADGSGETWAVNIDCTTAPHATTGTAPGITVNTASLNNGYLSTANSTGSGATFKRYFSAGTYDIKVRARNLGTSSGRGEVLVDGVSKGYFDTSVSTATNVLHTVATGVVLAAGAHEITVASYDRGTGATSWAVLVQTIDLIRTA